MAEHRPACEPVRFHVLDVLHNDKARADDLVQETLLEAYQKRGQRTGGGGGGAMGRPGMPGMGGPPAGVTPR